MTRRAGQPTQVTPEGVYELVTAPYREHEAAAPPTCLYHYTRHEGLIGIAETGEIWASDLRFLNDSEELSHGMQILEAAIYRARREGNLGPNGEPFEWLNEAHNPSYWAESGGVFAASFSAQPDDLNQWRAYCPTGGYCLGFSAAALSRALGDNATLSRVLYSEEEKVALADALIHAAANAWKSIDALPVRLQASRFEKLREAIEDVFVASAAVMKHESFAAEEEWRVIASGHVSEPEAVRYRPGQSTVVPYVALPVFPAGEKSHLDVAIAGPNPSGGLAADAMWWCLSDAGIHTERSYLSQLPYRSW